MIDFKSEKAKPLFIFEMANNHMGNIKHGIKIINEIHKVCKDFALDFDFAFKFQFRDLDTFIHPEYKDNFDYGYIKRFSETRLTQDQFFKFQSEAQKLGFITMSTPFDENSVNMIEKYKYDIIKIASCSFTDWPLLERIAKSDKPIIASTAGASLAQIDNVVSFFEHRDKQLTLMHCVAEYPTNTTNLQLNQLDLLKSRYPHVSIGYSTHEDPNLYDGVKIAIAKGAKVFEKHIAVETPEYSVNKYSATPDQVKKWLDAANEAFRMCGVLNQRMDFTEKELTSLRSLGRGVWAKKDIEKGSKINVSDVFLAIPTQEGQIIANDLSKYTEITAKKDIKKNEPILQSDTRIMDNREKIYKIVKSIKDVIVESGILVPSKLDLEISHHYGVDRFFEYGCTLVNFINRDYCKKLIIVVPNQKHPEQYHKLKEETFHVLYGDVEIELDGKKQRCKPGDMITVEKGVRHIFSTKTGAIIEEISSTHYTDDSFYIDPEIAKNKDRKTLITNWINV